VALVKWLVANFWLLFPQFFLGGVVGVVIALGWYLPLLSEFDLTGGVVAPDFEPQ
jgi:hypothetical protein